MKASRHKTSKLHFVILAWTSRQTTFMMSTEHMLPRPRTCLCIPTRQRPLLCLCDPVWRLSPSPLSQCHHRRRHPLRLRPRLQLHRPTWTPLSRPTMQTLMRRQTRCQMDMVRAPTAKWIDLARISPSWTPITCARDWDLEMQ